MATNIGDCEACMSGDSVSCDDMDCSGQFQNEHLAKLNHWRRHKKINGKVYSKLCRNQPSRDTSKPE